MVDTAENCPTLFSEGPGSYQWPTQTTQKSNTERKPKEVILWDRVLPSLLKTLSCLDDNLLNIYHMTLSGARTKAFCHSAESKMEGRKVRAPKYPQVRRAFYHAIYQISRVFTYVRYLEGNFSTARLHEPGALRKNALNDLAK